MCSCSVIQSYLTLCDPMDCSPQDSSVHGIILAEILQCVVISSSRGSSWPREWTHISFTKADSLQLSGLGNPQANRLSFNLSPESWKWKSNMWEWTIGWKQYWIRLRFWNQSPSLINSMFPSSLSWDSRNNEDKYFSEIIQLKKLEQPAT